MRTWTYDLVQALDGELIYVLKVDGEDIGLQLENRGPAFIRFIVDACNAEERLRVQFQHYHVEAVEVSPQGHAVMEDPLTK